MVTGKSYRRSQRDLYEMSEYFGEKCLEYGFTNSVRESFYNHDMSKQRDKLTFGEMQIYRRGEQSYKDDLRQIIKIAVGKQGNKTFEDVIRFIQSEYGVECRVAGNTVSYRHPLYLDKNGKPISIRGSRLGEEYTRKGIEYALQQKAITIKNTAPAKTAPKKKLRR